MKSKIIVTQYTSPILCLITFKLWCIIFSLHMRYCNRFFRKLIFRDNRQYPSCVIPEWRYQLMQNDCNEFNNSSSLISSRGCLLQSFSHLYWKLSRLFTRMPRLFTIFHHCTQKCWWEDHVPHFGIITYMPLEMVYKYSHRF